MKKILLTGATGFLGSHVLKKLLQDQYNIVVLKRSFSDTWRVEKKIENLTCYNIDVIDPELIFKENQIDTIIHTATNYGRNNSTLSTIIADNVILPVKLIESGLKYGCTNFINTDTFSSRANSKYDYLTHYNLSKKILLDSLKTLPVKVINCKLEHVYGINDNDDKFVMYIIKQMVQQKEFIDLTDGSQKRDFVFVEDVVNAYSVILLNLEQLPGFLEVEIGTGIATSIFDFVTLVKNAIPDSKTKLNWGVVPKRSGEFEESKADISLLSNLGWKRHTRLIDGIRKTVDYYIKIGV